MNAIPRLIRAILCIIEGIIICAVSVDLVNEQHVLTPMGLTPSEPHPLIMLFAACAIVFGFAFCVYGLILLFTSDED